MAKSSSISKTAVWILLGLLILGLAGFGATNLGGNIRTVGFVGDKPISTQSYFSAMQREMQAMGQQTGAPVTMAQARQVGLDQAVLQRLVTLRALDNEATEMGLSVGDENVRDQVLNIGAFQGLDGSFDRESYAFALEQQGMSEGDFETTLREETARTLLQGAVVNGVAMPDVFTNTIAAFAGEQRNFRWIRLRADQLDAPLSAASPEEVRAFYDENTDRFVLPVTKTITYAWVTPEMLVDTVTIDDGAMRQAYDDRVEEFQQPERRLVERLVFLDEAAAKDAKAALEVGGTTFEALVQERGLQLSDTDLGDVSRLELDAAGAAVFGAESGDVVGPELSELGPALFRVNGILPARSVSFEDAKETLRETVALDRARRVIEQQAESYEDLLAGGATLEELANDTDMQIGTIDWSANSGDSIAGYEEFRDAARQITLDDFPEIDVFSDGGVFALRLDEELPERPEPFEDAQEDVSAALEVERTATALARKADALIVQINDGASFEELGLQMSEETDRARGDFIPLAPPTLIREVFTMAPGDTRVVSANGIVSIVTLDEITPGDQNPETQQLIGNYQAQLNQALAQDLFNIFTNDVSTRTSQRIDFQAVEAVNANFP